MTTSYSANTVTVTDQAGKQRKSVTDGLGRLVQVYEAPNDPNYNYLTSYSYDTLDNLISVTQGTQTPRSFSYDSLKRLTSTWNPESNTIGYQYDNNGNLTQKTDARGVVSTYAYDALNRNTSITYSDGTPTVGRVYDGAIPYGTGRLYYNYTWATNDSTKTYTRIDAYDALGRVKDVKQHFWLNGNWTTPYAMAPNYDLAGHAISMSYPSGRRVTYSYDAAGRTNSFAGNLGDGGDSRNYSTGIIYSPFGGMSQEQFGTTPDPIYNKLFYNSRGQLAEIREGVTPNDTGWERGAIINHYSACWGMCGGYNSTNSMAGNNGNLQKQDVYIPGVGVPFSQFYSYDSLNRLQSLREDNPNGPANWQQAYSYDRYGNRTLNQGSTYGNGIPNPYFGVDQSTNRLTPAGGYTMGYDAAGNLTNDNYTGQGQRNFDAENKMTAAWSNGQWQSYVYDADGQRVKRIVNGVETWQIYGIGGELIAEYAANANPTTTPPQKEYGYRNGQLLITASVTAGGNWGTPPVLHDNPLNPNFPGEMTVQARHITELRDAINAMRSHLGQSAYVWQYSATTNDFISADPILELRTALNQTIGAPSGGYAAGLAQGQPVKAIHIQELRDRVLSAWSNGGSGAVDVRWLVADQLGTPRMIFDQSGSIATVSRHDYLPFGEELFANTGGRTTTQGYPTSGATSTDHARQNFTQKERDIETGLDYFGARYYGSPQGRFTTPDPLLGSGNPSRPQTWNRYAYVVNNPLRMIDPDGLDGEDTDEQRKKAAQPQRTIYVFVGGKDRGTPWQPDKNSAKAGYKPTTVPGDNFADLAKNAPKGTEVKVINEGDAQFSPQGFKDALADKSAAGVVFVGDTVGTTDADGVYQATGLDFGNNGSLSMGSPVQVNAQNVAIFGCDSSNLKSMFSFTGTNQSLIGMNSGSEGYSSPGWLGRAAYATASTFERGGNPDQAVLAANNRFHNFGATAPFGPKNVSRGINVHNAEPKDVGDSVLKLR